jgi:hypothetical protein
MNGLLAGLASVAMMCGVIVATMVIAGWISALWGILGRSMGNREENNMENGENDI